MSLVARMKSVSGGRVIPTLAAAATINVPDDSDIFNLTGTATVTSLTNISRNSFNRIITLYQSDSGSTTLTNSPGTTTAGQMDLGGLDSSNLVLGPTDSVELMLRTDGTWIRMNQPVNN